MFTKIILFLFALIIFIGCESELVVHDGTGSGVYELYDTIPIKADTPSEGKSFYRWNSARERYIDDIFSSDTSIKLTAKMVEVGSEYIPSNELTTLTVVKGTGSGDYFPGSLVKIKADEPTEVGYRFSKWVGDIATLSNSTSEELDVRVLRDDISLEATYEKEYEVTVESGSGSGKYFPGQQVAIKANTAPSGMHFKDWSGTVNVLSDPTNSTQLFLMPSNSLNFKANYDITPKYSLQVTGGSGSGSYYQGDKVNITADVGKAGEQFSVWEGSIEYLSDKASSSAVVTMPAKNISVKSTYITDGSCGDVTIDYLTGQKCASGLLNCDCSGPCGYQGSSCPDSGSNPGDIAPGPGETKEIASYHGRHNGDRPTWYFSSLMKAYPSSFTVVVSGCGNVNVVSNNGTRFESGSYIIKQSDVSGRGMALIAPATCKSTTAYVIY